ncbi:hypothetical protein ACFYWH_11215 [Streptomyces sp. NPDC003737]|uniref:hypothetical protein n=1 Tax=Streptomyces sp. NPDC003737 TaxID=3364685 RepID=UPI0036D0754B
MLASILAAHTAQSSGLPAAAVVAGCALVFTVASFWWLNARQGKLKSYEPHSFAGVATQQLTVVRLPLVFYNTGPKPIVVQNLQLRFPDEPDSLLPLPWRNSWAQLRPVSEDHAAMPAVFAVEGRKAEQLFIEFGAPFPGFIPQARDYTIALEATLGHRKGWRPLLTFTLRMSNMISPSQYITYSNSPRNLTEADREKANAALEALAVKLAEQQSP